MPHDDATTQRPVGDLSYEQARDELVSVVARLEAGGETLEGSLALWERGEALAARCAEWLDGARARLDAARPGLAPHGSGDGPDGGPTASGQDRGARTGGRGATPSDRGADAPAETEDEA